MSKLFSRFLQIFFDLLVLTLAFCLAYMIRFDWDPSFDIFKRFVFLCPYVVAFQYAVLMGAKVPRFAWRYVGLREVTRILVATGVSSSVLLAARFLAPALLGAVSFGRYAVIPIGVIFINAFLSFSAITGIRVLRRLLAERNDCSRLRSCDTQRPMTPTLLIGAGQAGVMVAKEIASRPDLGIRPVAFLDDDPIKVGQVMQGLPVVAHTDKLAEQVDRLGAEQVLITIANAPGKTIRRLYDLCEQVGIPAKIIPGIYEIVGGDINLSRIRDVAFEDLLGREQVVLDEEAIASVVRGQVVLVTGAGGSIGSELCRQITKFNPSKLVLVERAENNLFLIHKELSELFRNGAQPISGAEAPELVPCMADIGDAKRMQSIFEDHKPITVLHAAAHKHVPMMEWNVGEAVKNNVGGTRLLADLTHAHGCQQFVMISTDKAVNPSSVMGATKRTAEMYIQALSQTSTTKFVTVRFGNVLGSAGSVIPIFQEQIGRGGPVTVTHPDMKRYFMTIPEACQLVLQAATMGQGGEIFILDMGEPVKIVDLAKDLIKLSGFEPETDIEIKYTGLRPGEKLFEELSTDEEHADKTRHPKIFVGRFRPVTMDILADQVDELCKGADSIDDQQMRGRLRSVVTEFNDGSGGGKEPVSAAEEEAEEAAPLSDHREQPPLSAA